MHRGVACGKRTGRSDHPPIEPVAKVVRNKFSANKLSGLQLIATLMERPNLNIVGGEDVWTVRLD